MTAMIWTDMIILEMPLVLILGDHAALKEMLHFEAVRNLFCLCVS